MGIVEGVKDFLGIGQYGGEYGRIIEKIKQAKKASKPQEVADAEQRIKELTWDLSFRGDSLTMREHELLEKELPPLEAIARNFIEAEPLRQQAIKNLEEEKRLIEEQIFYWKNRKKSIATFEKPPRDEQQALNERTLTAVRRSIREAQEEISYYLGKINDEMEKLQKQKKTASPEKLLEIESKISYLEAAKHKNLIEHVPMKQEFIQEQEKRARSLEILIKNSTDSYKDAELEIESNLMRLIGKVD